LKYFYRCFDDLDGSLGDFWLESLSLFTEMDSERNNIGSN